MHTEPMQHRSEQARRAIDRGLAFLSTRQMASGQFETRMGRRLGPNAPGVYDSSPFVTTIVVSSLAFSDDVVARAMVARGTEFLRSTMDELGACKYWTVDHPGSAHIPPDVDTTASVSEVLRARSVAFPDNRHLIAANRDRHGMFYTWFAPRHWPLRLHRGYRRLVADQRRNPERSRDFWTSNDLSRDAVDSVVNINVLGYLGEIRATRRIVPYLLDVAHRNAEASSDQWYQSLITFYYAISRCIAKGIASLDPLADVAVDRLGRLVNHDGSIGRNAIETALAACALLNFGVAPDTVDRAGTALIASQSPVGSWPIAPIYFGGKKDEMEWGSEELTTALALEVLIRRRGRVPASPPA